jgi:hypothetical protein
VFVTGDVLVVKVTEYDVRCETALSRAWRIAASVVLYALFKRPCFNTGTMLMNVIAVTTMPSATTVIISSRLKPRSRCLRRPPFCCELLISIRRIRGFPLLKQNRQNAVSRNYSL